MAAPGQLKYKNITVAKKRKIEVWVGAGTLNKNLSGLISVKIFEQRDMDVTGLGFKLGETPFESLSTIKFSDKGYSCS